MKPFQPCGRMSLRSVMVTAQKRSPFHAFCVLATSQIEVFLWGPTIAAAKSVVRQDSNCLSLLTEMIVCVSRRRHIKKEEVVKQTGVFSVILISSSSQAIWASLSP